MLAASLAGQAPNTLPDAAAREPSTPAWLKPGAEIRGRAEGATGIGYAPGNDDGYYLHRLRLNLGVEPRRWLKFFFQVQDSRAPGYRKPAPSSAANSLDLRQGYLELGDSDTGSWRLRAGRQELSFGDERLVGPSNWGNVARTFDAAKLSYSRTGVDLSWFASAIVEPVNGRFDHPQTRNKFYGFYSSFRDVIEGSDIQPYFFWKTELRARDENSRLGDLDLYTYGLRAAGKLPRRFDYGLEIAFQSGHAAADSIRAWAGHWALGYSPWKDKRAPRLAGEYNYASGDKGPGDGRRGTFDQLFPTNHSKYGIADQVGWRNMRDAMGGIEWKPSSRWKFNLDYHSFWVASRADALYNASGRPAVRNPAVVGSRVGDEVDIQATYQLSTRLQTGFGYAHLFPADYLKQSTESRGVTYPYVFYNFRF